MRELVSIIVPVYRVEDLLARCLDSLLTQTYRELEIILVDDGSPDQCGAICDRYASQDQRVSVIHQSNAGLSAARNARLRQARGDFVTFVDSDDWLAPEFVTELLRTALRHGADISACGHVECSLIRSADALDPSPTIRVLSNVEALWDLLGERYVSTVVAWGKLYRRHLFDGIQFSRGRIHEDEFTTHQLLWRANRVAVSTSRLYFYWQREESITSSRNLTAKTSG